MALQTRGNLAVDGPTGGRRGLKTLRVGVIGLGVGERHALACQRHPQCEVTALCDLNQEKLQAMSGQLPAASIFDDADAMLQSCQLDLVVVASYDDAHSQQVCLALERDCHVFVEKPLCLRASELQAIHRALVAKEHLRLSSNLILRRSPRLRRLSGWIETGLFGRLFHMEAAYLYGRLHKITDGWRGQLPYYSVLMGGAIHMVDLLLWLSGREVTEVCGYGNQIASAGSGFAYNDMATALLRFDDGMTATVSANFGCVMPHQHGLSVFGTEATFVNHADGGHLYRSRERQVEPTVVPEPAQAPDKGELLAGFVDSIVHDTPQEVTAQSVLQTTAVCLAIEQAVSEGRAIVPDSIVLPHR